MPRAADDVLIVDLCDKGVFEEHCLIGFLQPRRESRLETLIKQTADIAEIRRAKHCRRKVNPVPQPSKRCLCLL